MKPTKFILKIVQTKMSVTKILDFWEISDSKFAPASHPLLQEQFPFNHSIQTNVGAILASANIQKDLV